MELEVRNDLEVTAQPEVPAPELEFDGGYGWVIVFSCGVITFFFGGTTYSWGIIQLRLVSDGLAPASTLAFVGSITIACIALFAIVNARLVRILGARNTGFLGASLLSLGEILSGWTIGSVGGLFVTAGVIMGLGTSLCFMVASVLPAQYFRKKRGLANGIVYAGGGIGGATISFMLDALLEHLGPAWTFRITGFITLTAMIPAISLIKERPIPRSNLFIEWRLFSDTKFILLFLSGVIGTFPILVPPFFLPLYGQSLGMTPNQAAALVAGYNLSSAAGRLGFGQLSDRAGPVNCLLLAVVLISVSLLALWPLSTTLAPLIAFTILNGVSNGAFFALMPTVVASVFGPGRVAVAMGMLVSGWTGGDLMGAPLAGYLLTAYGGPNIGLEPYRPAMYYAGSLSLACAGLLATLRFTINGDWKERV